MKIAVLDAKTLGDDINLSPITDLGEAQVFDTTPLEMVKERVLNKDVVVLNKVKFNENTVGKNSGVKLVCITATGFDNVDLDFCRSENIAVCNVVGYSTDSVAQVTAAMVLSLVNHLSEYDEFSKSGKYTKSGVHNCLTPVYHELAGKTWGIVGFGNIGKKVSEIAKALGCNILVHKRTPEDGYNCADIDTLCRESDIITLHTPLNEGTKKLINEERLNMMKENVILVNVARGAVTDEEAVCNAIINGKIAGFGTDVFSTEPYPENHCFHELKDFKNVIITPHMAWGAFEARQRCVEEISKNIRAFYSGEKRNRVD